MSDSAQVPSRVAARLLGMLAAAGLLILLLGAVLRPAAPRVTTGQRAGTGTLLFNVFWADGEANAWSWYSSSLLLLLAIGFVVHAVMVKMAGRSSWAYWSLAVVATYLSFDEAAQIHEHLFGIRFLLSDLQLPSQLWFLIGLPFALGVGAVLLRISLILPRAMRRGLIVAGAVYLGGAIGLEILGVVIRTTWHYSSYSLPYIVEVVAEEGAEAAGVLLALWAVLSPIVRTQGGADSLTVSD